MKAMKRKLLSLLLAMAMVLSLAPTALADDVPNQPGTTDNYACTVTGTATANVGQTVTLEASLTNNGTPVTEGVSYSWSIPTGMEATGGTTGKSVTIQATGTPTSTVNGNVTCTATPAGGTGVTSGNTAVTFTYVAPQPPVATNLSLSAASPATLTAGNTTTKSTVTATVTDGSGNAVQGVTVTATLANTSTAVGTSASVSGVTDAQGHATITVTAGNTAGTATFNVSAGDTAALKKDFSVTVNAAPPAVSNVTIGITGGVASVAAGSTLGVTVTGVTPALAADAYDRITWTSSDATTLTVSGTSTSATVTGVKAGTATVSVSYTKNGVEVAKGTSSTITVTGAPTVYIGVGNSSAVATTYSLAGVGSEVTLSVYVNGQTNQYTDYTYSWSIYSGTSVDLATGQYSNTYYQTVRGISVGTTYIDVTVYQRNTSTVVGTARIAVTVGNSGLQASATVYGGADYLLSDVDDTGKTSVVNQIEQMVRNSNVSRYLNYVVFTATTSVYGDLSANTYTNYYASGINTSSGGRLSDVVFSPKQAGTAYFSFRAYYYNGTNYGTPGVNDYITGTLAITVSNTVSTSDITYTATLGDDVSFTLKDFEDFYYSKTRGSLNYVSFTLPSGGSLYADGGRLGASNACYVSPSRAQTDLAGVYFSPTGTTATRASTVRISFTAYGNRSNASGTVAITYLSGSARDITYSVNNNAALKASDFTDAYRQVVGSTAPTGLTIQFQSVPTNGTLTYKDSSRTNSTAVTLRSSNIQSYKFTTRSTGSNQLADVTYTASGSRSDTIEYIAYVNNTPQFTGKVVFNGSNASASNMQVSFTSTGGQAVAFSYNAFVTANAAAMASTSYIRFVTMPTGGTLTYNGAAMSLTSTNVLPALLGSVVYRPSTGYNNSTDRVSFVCYDANGNSVGGGQVSIIVTGNTSGGSTGTTNVDQFKDVSATAWYRSDLSKLVNAGIIKGRGDGKFDPAAQLTYGEALKIFMLASGYPAQAEPSGRNWASNYKALAVSNGWISNDVDVTAQISRNAMAELAAKSLGVASSSSTAPWSDGTANGYAIALYYTSPQILKGNDDGTFKGTTTLSRAEICAIASRVMDYKNTQQSTERPGWLG